MKKKNQKKLKELIKCYDLYFYQLFSEQEKNKWNQYCVLGFHYGLINHLPVTVRLDWENLQELLETHNGIVIKPITGSLGKRIVMIEKKENLYYLYQQENGEFREKKLTLNELEDFFQKNHLKKHKYTIQQKIQAQTFKGRATERRISVQKIEKDEWAVTGKAVRIAPQGSHVTNISQGAEAVFFEKVFPRNPGLDEQIKKVSINIAKQIENYANIIDLGLDLMVDENQHDWLIEVNLRDQRLTYKKAYDLETWYSTTINPPAYIYKKMNEV